ncbi:MAG: IS4 family transposase [Bacteroidetes bacterium]|nr:IS4 family transposase [Bacteroidota bacterium]
MDNENVSEAELISSLTKRCKRNVQGKDVLVIQDSSSYGLGHLKESIEEDSGLGLVGNKMGLGFLTHISLVLDAQTEDLLGYSDVQLWHRKEDKSNNTTRIYKQQPIEEKESYKWIKASESSKAILSEAATITIIEDREGDIYDQFCTVPDDRTDLIIRSRSDRKLADGSSMDETIKKSKSLGQLSIPIIKDLRKQKIARIAQAEIKVCKVELERPHGKYINKELPKSKELFVVNVQEKSNVKIKDPIHWRILTTIEVRTGEDAEKIIERYKQRWYIEQLFRLTKKQGFKIEQTQLKNGWGIRKLYLLVLAAALKVMQLYLAYGVEKSQPITNVFDEKEIECLEKIEQKLKVTEATTNPYSPKVLAWASWIIGRLGGWKGNPNQRPPGPIILLKGVEKFENIYEGWKLASNYT